MDSTITKKALIKSFTASERALKIEWEDGKHSTFHYIWLRDNCSSLLDPISGQREINPMEIPKDIHPESVTLSADRQLEIVWAHDQHLGRFKPEWLRAHCYSNSREKQRWQPTLWDAPVGETLPVFDYEDVFTREEAMREWLSLFRDYGFARLRNVPVKSKIVSDIAKKLSYIWTIGYGDFFEIKAMPEQSDFLAYTNKALPSHTDDAYFDPAPPVQALHCIKNEVEGGESTLVDGFKIAAVLRKSEPEKFKLLSTVPVHFRLHTKAYDFSAEVPLIRLDESGTPQEIRFSNQSIQPFQCSPHIMEAYYEAYCTFSKMIVSKEFQLRFRFKPGDFNMINNRRILHGRTAFSKTGERHLQSCYLGFDGLYSRLTMLNRNLSNIRNGVQD